LAINSISPVARLYARLAAQFLKSSPLPEKEVFIKSFVREIKVTGSEGLIAYTFPVPPGNLDEENCEEYYQTG
jgi:hypothetical protein